MKFVRRRYLFAIALAALILGAGCGQKQSPEPAGASKSDENTVETIPDEAIQGYTEGPSVPDGWPVDLIPLPPGAAPVASLDKTAVPDAEGEGYAVFYSADQSVQEITQFFTAELLNKGWKILETTPPDQYVAITAQNGGYVGIFGIGQGLGPPQTSSGKKIAFEVLLGKET